MFLGVLSGKKKPWLQGGGFEGRVHFALDSNVATSMPYAVSLSSNRITAACSVGDLRSAA
jgi:hypothetical protein